MAMVIKNNVGAMLTLGELKKNSRGQAKVMEQLATGMKIVGAGDGAAEFSISERMRVRLRGLAQATNNTSNMRDMLKVASGGVDQQVEIMRKVYTIALKATDDTYTDIDRGTLQKEVSQLLDQSDDIAQETTYNGIQLLNQRVIGTQTKWFDADVPYRDNPTGVSVLSQFNGASSLSVPQGTYTAISVNPPNTYDPTGGFVSSGSRRTPYAGHTVWNGDAGTIDVITKDANGSLVFQSTGQAASYTNTYGIKYAKENTTMPAIGDVVATSATPVFTSGTTTLDSSRLYEVKTQPGTDAVSYYEPLKASFTQEIDFSSLFTGGLDIPSDLTGLGFSIDCDACTQYIAIQFDSGTRDSKLYVGTSDTKSEQPLYYVIGTASVTDEQSLMETVFNGITATSQTAGGGTIPSTTDTSTTITTLHNIKLNYIAATGKMTLTKDGYYGITLRNGIMGELKTNTAYKPEQQLVMQSSTKAGLNTVVNVPNTTTSILFPRSGSDWDIDPKDSDIPTAFSSDYANCTSDAEKIAKWKNEAWQYPDKYCTLDLDNCVATRDMANVFLDNVDQAIKYLLQANTTLGAQINRAEITSSNLTIASENLAASESVLRDSDMAKEMVEFTRLNILSQSAQSMLAQANQDGSRVLSLLQ